ncbi:hypothetical protein LTR53_004328 [Teratosphaeriaceae sp. CCFEE 6253]|nr:hypothetical protein LTR53_004328 [Teratosphaeriaceae sp. CCFEE 6253]
MKIDSRMQDEKHHGEAPPYQQYEPTIHSQDATLYDREAQTVNNGPPMDEISSPYGASYAQPHPAPAAMDYVPAPRMVTPLDRLTGTDPQEIDCPYCNNPTQTRVQQEHSNMTYIKGIMLGVFCCVCLVCLPCIGNWDQDLRYYCNGCNKQLAYKPYNGPVSVLATPKESLVPSKHAAPAPVVDQPVAAHRRDERNETAMDVFTPYSKGPK